MNLLPNGFKDPFLHVRHTNKQRESTRIMPASQGAQTWEPKAGPGPLAWRGAAQRLSRAEALQRHLLVTPAPKECTLQHANTQTPLRLARLSPPPRWQHNHPGDANSRLLAAHASSEGLLGCSSWHDADVARLKVICRSTFRSQISSNRWLCSEVGTLN